PSPVSSPLLLLSAFCAVPPPPAPSTLSLHDALPISAGDRTGARSTPWPPQTSALSIRASMTSALCGGGSILPGCSATGTRTRCSIRREGSVPDAIEDDDHCRRRTAVRWTAAFRVLVLARAGDRGTRAGAGHGSG